MPLDLLASAAKDVSDNAQRIFASLLRNSDSAADYVAERIRLWQLASAEELKAEFPFALYEQQLSDWQTRNQSPLFRVQNWQQLLRSMLRSVV